MSTIHDEAYWEAFYKKNTVLGPSSFATFVLPFLKGTTVELGCGNGRDTHFFAQNKVDILGVDSAFEGRGIVQEDVFSFIQREVSPDYVYTRFFWHSIDWETQLEILKWTKDYIFIEARTTKDIQTTKVHGGHQRNYVDIQQLEADLLGEGFTIEHMEYGYGLSVYQDEDPHLVRIIARKKK